MSSTSLLLEGLELMLIGMVLVFLFLVLLIGCIRLMSSLLRQAPDQDAVPAIAAVKTTAVCELPDADTLVAIGLALKQHQGRHA